MNKTLIAAAVSAAIMAPMAAQADVTVYGRINNALDFNDPGGDADSTTDVTNVGSRFGIKASADLGNGLTATARYEWGTTTDHDDADLSTRLGVVGLSGGFGSVTVGQQWNAFYNIVGTHIDPTVTLGGGAYLGQYRTPNTIKYANSFGPASVELDVRLDDDNNGAVAEGIEDEGGNGAAIGVSIAPSENITVALAYDDHNGADGAADDIKRTGAAVRASFGNMYGILGWNKKEGPGNADTTGAQLWLGTSLGESSSVMVGYGKKDPDGEAAEPSAVTLSLSHRLGGGMQLWYEGQSNDPDTNASNATRHLLGMRYDF